MTMSLTMRNFCKRKRFKITSSIKDLTHFNKKIGFTPLIYRFFSSEPQNLTLSHEDENGIRTITLNDPSRRNALSYNLMTSFMNHLSPLTPSLSCLIIKANGSVFSSGLNLKEFAKPEESFKIFELSSKIMKLIQSLPVPVIAQVQGLATAAGCQLAASCDLVVAAKSVKFATPGVSNSLFCTTPGVALSRSLSSKVALYMLFTGFPITAYEAYQHGLVSKLVEDEELEGETRKIALKISQASRPVVRLGKKSFYEQKNLNLDQAYQLANDKMFENVKMRDAREGVEAFTHKRKPVWNHE